MRFSKLSVLIATIVLIGCSSNKEYRPIVDTSRVDDKQKLASDMAQCEQVTNAVDYSAEETKAALKGAGAGVAVVGTGAAIVAGAGGIVLAPVVLPIAGIAALVGAGYSGSGEDKKEQKMRAIVFNNCLKKRGYEVLSDEGLE